MSHHSQRGFLSFGSHLIGLALFCLALGFVAALLDQTFESRLVFWVILAVSFVPLFVATHAVGNVIGRKLRL